MSNQPALWTPSTIHDNVAHHQSRNTIRSFALKIASGSWMKQHHLVAHNVSSSKSSLPWNTQSLNRAPVIQTN
jgi:hypothetical protein